MFITLSHYHYILVFRDLQRSLTTKLAIRSGLVVPCCPAWHGRAPFILNQWIWSCDQRDEEHQFEDFFGDGDGESEREREKEFYDFGNQVACVLLFFDLLGAEHPYIILYFPFVLANCDLLHERWGYIYIYIFTMFKTQDSCHSAGNNGTSQSLQCLVPF